MRSKIGKTIAAVLLGVGLCIGSSQASVVIGGTRVVYPAQDKDVTIKLTNEGTRPALVQVWLDAGDEKSTPDTAKVPFTVSPPVFRMDAGKGQAMRVMYTQEALPTDRESLFWVNVLEVPPKAADGDERNLLQFAFRTRIKLFFRPPGLEGNAAGAPAKLSWRLRKAADGKGMALVATNPTAFHVSFASVGVKTLAGETKGAGGMVGPRSSAEFPLPELPAAPAGPAQASFATIADYGAVTPMTSDLAP
jgi:chaperone protein EcpD